MDTTAFIDALKKAIRNSLESLRTERPAETLAGFVLVTDDDLVTVVGMAITQEELASSTDPDRLFCPTDWPLEPEAEAFNALSRVLWDASPDEDSFVAHRDASFALLVDALAAVRDEGSFSSAVYLSVLSSDPGPDLEVLEAEALVRLNEPRLLEQRERFLKKWA